MKIYSELADWFHQLTAPEDYVDEARAYREALKAAAPGAKTLLELGAGGGNNAFHLKRDYQCMLTDISAPMLSQSRKINPDCEHAEGDMRTLRLGRTFDVVLIHDAINYMLTEKDLRAAFATAWEHCRPGGAVLVAPDFTTETFAESLGSGGHGDLRYLEWCFDPDPSDTTVQTHFSVLIREGGKVRSELDSHLEGLFPRATWIRLLTDVGFKVTTASRPIEGDGETSEIYLGLRPR